MAIATFAFVLLALGVMQANCSQSVDSETCTQPFDASALLQGPVAVQRMTGVLSDEVMPDAEARKQPAATETLLQEGESDNVIEATLEEAGRRKDAVARTPAQKQGESPTSASCVDHPSRRRSGLTCLQLSAYSNKVGQTQHNLCRAIKHGGAGTLYNGKIETNEAADTCCATCATAPVNIGFGGAKAKANRFGSLLRPEEMKFEQCLAADCRECASATNCWAGSSSLPRLSINVAAGGAFSHYRAVVSTKCAVGSQAMWTVFINPSTPTPRTWLSNGYVMLFKDNIFAQKLVPKPETLHWTAAMNAGPNKLQIDFHPVDSASPSMVEVRLEAQRVDTQFEHCLDGKNCLDIFGDGSAAGYAMRNVNKNQMDCLDGKAMNATLQKKCAEWRSCVEDVGDAHLLEMMPRTAPTSQSLDMASAAEEAKMLQRGGGEVWKVTKAGNSTQPKIATAAFKALSKGKQVIEFLKAFLHAAGTETKSAVGSQSLAQETSSGQLQESEECFDPAIADPEALECECMDVFINACGGVDQDCFVSRLCAQSSVCKHWKDANCASASSLASLGLRQTRIGTHAVGNNDLDSTASGKCAE